MHRAQRTADDRRDSHPHWCSFPRGLHLRLRWQCISRLQFKAKGPNFHAELIPVHSPLLRESYLVSYPPLTYMLKFSGFANLTSCLEMNHQRWRISGIRCQPPSNKVTQTSCSSSCKWSTLPVNWIRQGCPEGTLAHKHARMAAPMLVGMCQWHEYQ